MLWVQVSARSAVFHARKLGQATGFQTSTGNPAGKEGDLVRAGTTKLQSFRS
jgi:hypothetical protein